MAGSNALACPAPAGAFMGAPTGYRPCPTATRVGGFRVVMQPELPAPAGGTSEGFSKLEGSVAAFVDTSSVPVATMQAGVCRLITSCLPFCEDNCGAEQKSCGSNGRCFSPPTFVDMGAVDVSGLEDAVMVTQSKANLYQNAGTLPHPAAKPGADVKLQIAGGAQGSLSLSGKGVELLAFESVGIEVARDKALTLKWKAPVAPDLARMHVTLNVNTHGSGSLAYIECDAPDTGSLEIAANLIAGLSARGLSGFPSVTFARRTVDSTEIAQGCVELEIASVATLAVTVAGVTSCNEDSQCSTDQRCEQPGLPGGLTCVDK